jgi:hypothetical protein
MNFTLSQDGSLIDWIQLFVVVMLAPFFLFPSMKFIFVLLVVPLIWICRRSVKGRFFERTVLDWAIALLLIQVIVTCLIVPDIDFSLAKITGILFGLIFFYSLVALLTSEKWIKWGIVGFLSGSFGFSIICLLGMKWAPDPFFLSSFPKMEKICLQFAEITPFIDLNLPGAEVGFNPNAVGGTIVIFFPLFLAVTYLFLQWRRESSGLILSLFLLFVTVFIFSVLFLTLSFSSWAAVVLSIWFLVFPPRWKIGSFLLAIFLGVFLFFLSPAKDQYRDIFWGQLNDKIMQRSPVWAQGIQTIVDYPITGIGMNRIRTLPYDDYERPHTHNHFMHTAAEMGIPALVAYIAILMGAAFMCVRVWQRSERRWMRLIVLGLGCGQMAHFLFGLVDSIPLGAKVGIFFWLSIGLITAIYNFEFYGYGEVSFDPKIG